MISFTFPVLSFCLSHSSSQGYPQALLPLTVAGIPSIHICLDFIPELLAQPQLEKQVRLPNLYPPHISPLFCWLQILELPWPCARPSLTQLSLFFLMK